MKKARCTNLILFLVVFIPICILFFHEMIFFYPKGIHEWAQADRLSLAISFYDNGMNFFLPSTHFLGTTDGVTNVEFPIQSYLAAAIAHLFGRDTISTIFRILNLCISLLGLYYLFIFSYSRTKNLILSLLPPVFLFASPIYLFYSCNYLPDTAGLSIAIIAYYYFFKFIDTKEYKSLLISMSIITLATLIKTSIGIYFVAIIGHAFLILLFNKTQFPLKKIYVFSTVSLLLFSTIAGYFFYNEYIRTTYNSWIFLANINPVKSWSHFTYALNDRILGVWFNEYFIELQYYILYFFALLTVYLIIKKPLLKNYYFQHFLIALIGVLCFFYLMSGQFIDHDYYALAIFFPFIIMSLTTTLIGTYKLIQIKYIKYINYSFGLLLPVLLVFSYIHHSERISDHDWEMSKWMQKGSQKLDQLKIPKEVKILVMGHDSPNLGLVYFDRNGLIFNRAPQEIYPGLVSSIIRDNKLNYAVSGNEYYNWIINENKDGFSDLEIVFQDEKCVILKPKN